MRPFYRAIPAVCMALVNIGLRVSGYTNFGLAITMWVIAGVLALLGARPWIAKLWPEPLPARAAQSRKREPDSLSVATTPLKPERDVWLRDAMWWAFLRTWDVPEGGMVSLNVGESENQRFAMLVIDIFRQLAFEGKLPIWGKRKDSSIWEAVPREFWRRNHIDHILVLSADDPEVVKAQAERFWENPVTSGDWHHFMTSKAVIEQLYPRQQ
jgi:hypothetical protein